MREMRNDMRNRSRRFFLKVLPFLVVLLVLGQTLALAQACGPTVPAGHTSESMARPGSKCVDGFADRCPAQWLTSDESVGSGATSPSLPPASVSRALAPIAFARIVFKPLVPACRVPALSPPPQVLFANLRF